MCPSGPIPLESDKLKTPLGDSNKTKSSPTSDKKLDSASLFYLFLVVVAFFLEIWRVSIQNVNIVRIDVDVLEQILKHEGVI